MTTGPLVIGSLVEETQAKVWASVAEIALRNLEAPAVPLLPVLAKVDRVVRVK